MPQRRHSPRSVTYFLAKDLIGSQCPFFRSPGAAALGFHAT